MKKRKTAGELSLSCQRDTTKYNDLERAYALTEDIQKELETCIRRHNPIFDEDEYCVGYVLASDPLIKNVMRRKYYAMLYMPSPRPEQTIFLYNKREDKITKRLWTLPNAARMAILSEDRSPPTNLRQMKGWCDAFFNRKFWPYIRREAGINMLSEIEYLNANREELIKAGAKQIDSSFSEPFDFSKISIKKIIDTKTILSE